MFGTELLNRETRLLIKMLTDSAVLHDVAGIDADEFFTACLRHRLINIICQQHKHQLELLPRTLRARLHEENRKSGLRQLENIAEMMRICTEFEKMDIRYHVIKGAPLSQMLYNDAGARMSRDIDFIIYKPHLESARAIVERMGYVAKDLATAVHYSFKNAEDIVVELHSQLSVFGMNMRQAFSRKLAASGVIIADRLYPIPDISEYFVYLCYHGAVHGWYRLLWLTDIAGICSGNLTVNCDFEKVAAIAKNYGLTDVVGQALVLARELLGADCPKACRITQRAENLAVEALKLAITRDCPLDDCFNFTAHPKREFCYQLAVQGSLRNRLFYLLTPTVEDRRQVSLPVAGGVVLVLLRPLLLLWRVLGKLAKTKTRRVEDS